MNNSDALAGKPRLGISTCLLGERVRYDGGHKLDHYLRDVLGEEGTDSLKEAVTLLSQELMEEEVGE